MRENWNSRSIFIMAAVGSAIGLGNMWRFPYIAAQNGGGAFLVPYFIALLTAGIPIMIIEYGLGVRTQGSANLALGSINKKLNFIGWFAILGAFGINIYYCMVMSWSWIFLLKSFSIVGWAGDVLASKNHFFSEILKISKGPWDFKEIHLSLLFGLAFTWIVIWFIVKSGLKKIGKILLFTVPFPVFLIIILLIRGLTLEGATSGLNYYLSPDWSQLLQAKVWLAAYGQIFFSLSVGFGTMIAYASFMPKDTELPNSAAITSFANCSFSFLAGLAVFSVLGYFAVATNTPISEAVKSGPGLAFVVYPAALAKLPFAVPFFAFLFFLVLLLLGIDSAFSLLETVSAALSDKFNFSREKSTSLVALVSFFLGIPFATSAGLYWLDIIDHFIMSYVITFVAIMECLAVGWILGTKTFIKEVNRKAEIKIGSVFSFMIKFFTPFILGSIMIFAFIDEIKKPYEGYSLSAILILGVGTVILLLGTSFLLAKIKDKT